MVDAQKMLSVNQTNAQIKYTEMWKATNSDSYPIEMARQEQQPNRRISRSVTNKNFIEPVTQRTFIFDATRPWNKAPESIKSASSIRLAKKEIKKLCKTLQI